MTADLTTITRTLAEHRLHRSLNVCVDGTDRFPPACKWKPEADAGLIDAQHRAHLATVLAATYAADIAAARKAGAADVVERLAGSELLCDLADFMADQRDAWPRIPEDMDSQELANATGAWLRAALAPDAGVK